MSNRRKESEKNTRRLKALAKKPTANFLNQYGQTPHQIKKLQTYTQNRQSAAGRMIVSNKPNKGKPKKVHKRVNLKDNRLLVSTPANLNGTYIEYPVPDWFKYQQKPDVSIIIPLYKSHNVITDLIDSYQEPTDIKTEIIFIDDSCPNNSKEVAIRAFSHKAKSLNGIGKIIYSTSNNGYGISNNIGTQYASGKYLIFLNADTKLTANWIKPIIELLEDETVGIVGNLQIKEGGIWNNTIDGAGSEWMWSDLAFSHIGRHCYKGKHIPQPFKLENAPKDILKVEEREMVTGCCFGIRADLFKYIGGFNPNYKKAYWEDSEICMQVKELGYKIMFQPNSKIYHKLGHAQAAGHVDSSFNSNYFINKWVSSGRIDKFVKQQRPTPLKVQKILLSRREARGDVLLAASVLPALKEQFPEAKFFFSTGVPEVLQNNPYVERIVKDVNLAERLFDVFYNLDLVYEYRPHTHILNAYAEHVGVAVDKCVPYLYEQPIPGLPDKYIVVHAGVTGWAGRDWTLSNFNQLLKRLKSTDYKIMLVGNDNREELECDIDFRGKTNIGTLSHVIKHAKFFLGIDSFPMHVAQTHNTPGLCFFGCIDPKLRLFSPNMESITADSLSCLGCHHNKQVPCVVTDNCLLNTLDCIQLVTVDVMYDKVRELFKKFSI